MTLTLDATVGGSAANSYLDQAAAAAYFAGRPFASAWTNADATAGGARDQALVFATSVLEREKWAGAKGMTPQGALTQALAWPRRWAPTREIDAGAQVITEYFIDLSVAYYDSTTIPKPIKDATCELALVILGAGAADPFTDDARRVKRKAIGGAIDIEYFATQDSIRGLAHFPHVVRLVSHLLRTSGLEVERV